LCAYLSIKDFLEPADMSFIRDVLETLWCDNNNQQFLKLRIILETVHQRHEVLDYVLRFMCMHTCLDMIAFILSTYKVSISAEIFTVAILSTNETNKYEMICLLLNNGAPIDGLNFWVLKYTAYTGDWDKFKFLFHYYLRLKNVTKDKAVKIADEVTDTLAKEQQLFASTQIYNYITEFYH